MAPVQKFFRWLKGKTSDQKHQAAVARLRNLPPIPPNGYEYGFPVSESSDRIHETHVYEEIPYVDISTNTPSDKTNLDESTVPDLVSTMQKLDISGAKTVGAYLIVPIKTGTDKDPDIINHSKHRNKDEYVSLSSMIPQWAEYQLNNVNKKRFGLAVSRGYSVDEPPRAARRTTRTSGTHRYHHQSNDSGCESPSLHEKSLDSGHGSDDTGASDDQCFRDHSGTSTDDLSQISDWEFDKNSDSMLIETSRLMDSDDITTVPGDISSTSEANLNRKYHVSEQQKRTSSNHRSTKTAENKYHVEAEALFDQLFQSSQYLKIHRNEHDGDDTTPAICGLRHAPINGATPHRANLDSYNQSDKITGLSSLGSVTSARKLTRPPTPATRSHRLSCRINTKVHIPDSHKRRSMDFRLNSRSSRMSTSLSSGVESDYGSIYGSVRGTTQCAQNRFLGDIMRMNHERHLMGPW